MLAAFLAGAVSLSSATMAQVANDPGPRAGAPGAGAALPGLTVQQLALFNAAREVFREVDSVSGTMPGEPGAGLGPTFNMNSCAGCHAQPAIGGTSPAVNPQVAVATLRGARNVVPPFITLNGPVRVARFVRNPDGSADGGVHGLFTIAGRVDAPGCNLPQTNFGAALGTNNVIFRIPTPLFGAGLVETTPDENLQAAFDAQAPARARFAIAGRFNRDGNDGTITRFGWKAQNKSLLIFSGEAYNVEQGVSNDVFPNERSAAPGCVFNPTPEDTTRLAAPAGSTSLASDMSSDTINFAMFARFAAAPKPAPATPQVTQGRQLFTTTGCSACHVVQQASGRSATAALNQKSYEPFSDFALHDMGDALADGISQGNATGREFRTAPLWGLGQRLFFLHDGRTSDLKVAIQAHASRGSEANAVVAGFNALAPRDQQALLTFLRSL